MLRVRRQRFETERESFERDMVDVLRRESQWSEDISHSDRVRKIPRGSHTLPTFSLPCVSAGSLNLDSELASLRATTAETKRFVPHMKQTAQRDFLSKIR